MFQKYLVKEHPDFVYQYNIHFTKSTAKIESNSLHSNPFYDDEIHKTTFFVNNLFEVTSLDRKGRDEHFIYKTYVVAEWSHFMSTFEFFYRH